MPDFITQFGYFARYVEWTTQPKVAGADQQEITYKTVRSTSLGH